MTISRLLTQTVTIRSFTTGAEDDYGNAAESWSAGTTSRARLEQRSGLENTKDRNTQIGDWLLILPPGAVITGRDRVVYGPITFEVVSVAEQVTPRGEHHWEAQLRSVDG